MLDGTMNRRKFLQTASGLAVLLAASPAGLTKAFARGKPAGDQDGRTGSVEKRFLGGLNVSAIGLGCLPMVGYYGGKYREDDMIKMIRHACDAGVTFLTPPRFMDPIPVRLGWARP